MLSMFIAFLQIFQPVMITPYCQSSSILLETIKVTILIFHFDLSIGIDVSNMTLGNGGSCCKSLASDIHSLFYSRLGVFKTSRSKTNNNVPI